MYDDYRRGGSPFGAFIFGGLIGAVIALLFAPRSGKETREMLSERGQDYLDQATDLYEEGRGKLVEAYSSAKTVAVDRAEELKGKVDETREVLKSKVDEAATAADQGLNKTASAAKTGIDVAGEKAKDALEFVTEKGASTGAPAEEPLSEITVDTSL